MAEFDYIIVGAGAAGCVLAHRLSADPQISVALLEAGGADDSYFVKMPKGLAKVMQDPQRTWLYPAQPEACSAFKEEVWARGRLMGGSSSINGMMYVRGQPADFDELFAQSSVDWAWEHIAEAYRALEFHELGGAPSRGANGPLRISLPDRRNELTEAVIQAGISSDCWPREATALSFCKAGVLSVKRGQPLAWTRSCPGAASIVPGQHESSVSRR